MSESPKIHAKAIFWACGASGAAALIYEVVWFRVLTNTIGATIYSFSVLVAAFLAGLALGGRWGGIYADRNKNLVQVFGRLQLGIAVFGAALFYGINNLSPIYGWLFYKLRLSFGAFTLAQTTLVFLLLLVPTTLMGANFPVVVKIWSEKRREIGHNAGDVYAVNTWGAVLGSLAAGFLLVPLLGLRWSSLTAAAINLALAFLALWLAGDARRWLGVTALGVIAVPLLMLPAHTSGLSFGYGVAGNFGSLFAFREQAAGLITLFDKESPYGRVQVFEEPPAPGETRGNIFLVNGGRIEGSTGSDLTPQKIIAYMPRTVHQNPRSALDIGLGTGMTLATVLEDSRLEKVHSAEINQAVNEAVEQTFYPNLFTDRRLTTVIDDARHYLALSREKYDIIISEPSYPTSEAESHLFTKEFYEIVNRRLNEDGIFMQWLPGYILTEEQKLTGAKTLAGVFPNLYIWETGTDDVIFLNIKSKRKIYPARLKEQMKQTYPELGEFQFIAGPVEIAQWVADPSVPINTDDFPRIEFSTARNKLTGLNKAKF